MSAHSDSWDLKRTIDRRQEELQKTIIEAVRELGNTTKENIEQLREFRDAFKDSQNITVVDHTPILDIYSFSAYEDVFSQANISLLQTAITPVLPQFTMIQYNEFSGKHSELYSLIATPEELARLAVLEEQEEQERKEQERFEKQKEINVALVHSLIPESRWDEYTFESFNVTDTDKSRSNKDAYRLARQFTIIDCHSDEENWEKEMEKRQADWHNFLTFIGTPGCGKTRLALTIGLYLIRSEQKSVKYWQVQDLFETLKGTFNKSQRRHNFHDGNDDEGDDSYNKIIESLKNCDTLILDDLGAENGTEWVRSILDMIINHRYENKMETIITSNVSDISELSPRIASRLSEGNVCKILMPDFRKIKAVQREKKSRKVASNG